MVGAIIIPLIIAVVGIIVVLIIRKAIKKRKAFSESLPSSELLPPSELLPISDKAQTAKTQDSTQFQTCPNCGRDTQMKDGRQYCSSCKIYLSI